MSKKPYRPDILEIRRDLDRRRECLCGCLYDILVKELDSIKVDNNPIDGHYMEAGEVREQAESALIALIPEKGYINIRNKDRFAEKIKKYAQKLFRKSDDYQPVTQELMRISSEIKNLGKRR